MSHGNAAGVREREPGQEHRAVLCADDDAAAAHAVERLHHAVVSGRSGLAVLREDTEPRVREALDARGTSGSVVFLPQSDIYSGDAEDVHRFYRQRLRELSDRPLSVVSQHDPVHAQTEDPYGTRCLQAEVLADRDLTTSTAHPAVRQDCLYAAFRNRHLLGNAALTHPRLVEHGEERANPDHRPASALLAEHPALAHLDPDAVVRDVGPDEHIEDWLAERAHRAGSTGTAEFAVGVHEARRSVFELDPGREQVRLYLRPGGRGGLACDLDCGRLPSMVAGRLPRHHALGFLWLIDTGSGQARITVHQLDAARSRIRVRPPAP